MKKVLLISLALSCAVVLSGCVNKETDDLCISNTVVLDDGCMQYTYDGVSEIVCTSSDMEVPPYVPTIRRLD